MEEVEIGGDESNEGRFVDSLREASVIDEDLFDEQDFGLPPSPQHQLPGYSNDIYAAQKDLVYEQNFQLPMQGAINGQNYQHPYQQPIPRQLHHPHHPPSLPNTCIHNAQTTAGIFRPGPHISHLFQHQQQFQAPVYQHPEHIRRPVLCPRLNTNNTQAQQAYQHLCHRVNTNNTQAQHLYQHLEQLPRSILRCQFNANDIQRPIDVQQINNELESLPEEGIEHQGFSHGPNVGDMKNGESKVNGDSRKPRGRPSREIQAPVLEQPQSSMDAEEIPPVKKKLHKGGPGRPRGIFEPDHLRRVEKKCPNCPSLKTEFQYFNNQKTAGQTQPRYKCMDCGKKFTYYG